MARRKGQKHGRFYQLFVFLTVYPILRLTRIIPLRAGVRVSRGLGLLGYYFANKRRRIAIDNLRHVFMGAKSESEIRLIARRSCSSFVTAGFEALKFIPLLSKPDGYPVIQRHCKGLDALFLKASELHHQSGGCIFVTPHLGNWEFLPFVGFGAGIAMVVVVRPLDNPYLEKLLYQQRQASGQIIIPKTNSMHLLQMALRRGKSVAMLPDQATMKAISVDYLGRKATTTPVPAFLAVRYHRPIVVVACCRKSNDFDYEGMVSDPIWPDPRGSEKPEILRLTELMNREMGELVKRFPEQYLWMHDRWKRYSSKGELLAT
jgi:KDO2-lipid IV(A) lauroyltransferase